MYTHKAFLKSFPAGMLAANREVALITDTQFKFIRGSDMARCLIGDAPQKGAAAPCVRSADPIPAQAECLRGEFGEDES